MGVEKLVKMRQIGANWLKNAPHGGILPNKLALILVIAMGGTVTAIGLPEVASPVLSTITCVNPREGKTMSMNKTSSKTAAPKKTGLVRLGAAAVALSSAIGFATPAAAEVTASAAVSNMYLWRGLDLGNGDAAVSGDLRYTNSGAYVGVWLSSGDSTLGNEYDYYAGYGNKIGDFTYDLSLWNYNYSDAGLDPNNPGFDVSDDTTGDLSEVIATLGYGGFVSFSYYDNIAGASGYEYYTLSGIYEQFSVTLGYHDPSGGNDILHANLTYAFNSNLSFTVSKVVDQDTHKNDPGAVDEDVKFVVTYALPINM
jgi:uncharacterized protein (TIGR02001 family)